MSKTLAVRSLAAFAVCFGAWVAYTQNQPPAQPSKVNKLANDLYELEGDGGNVAVYLTDEGVIVVDDKFERNYNDIMADIKKLTDKPVKYVLNTHQHGDHTGGNEKMKANGVQVIVHRNARVNMVAGKQPGLPHVSFTDQAQVYLGGKEVDAYYNGRGHTNGDVVIYFPALRVLHTGDLFTTNGQGNVAPFIDYNGMGSAAEWTKTLDGVLKLDFDTVIPGHGPISKKADLQKYRDGFEKMQTGIRAMSRQGKGRDDVLKMLVADFGWAPSGLGTNSLDRVIAELK
ncbi:MAG: MBL fold metallo-hydrolase [Bryobacterales bacterium]|nr:MBL fold metallo-hydrolase [Bryobacterales bacterium]MBV9397132.1 MBL fold metallo-hydrolase [Bryobacterales bacterium]